MIPLSLLLVILVIIAIQCDTSDASDVSDERKEKCPICPITPKHYQELGCVGNLDKNGCCFESFECRDFTKFESNKCNMKGRSYELLDKIDARDAPPCRKSCQCVNIELPGHSPIIFCTHKECPVLFKPKQFSKKECITQYDSSGCCQISKVCDKKEMKRLAKCTLDGVTYRQGQIMYPKNYDDCYSCICSTTFNESIPAARNKDCRLVDCEMELRYFREIQRGCVPVYFGVSSCCPLRFRCPNENDEVMLMLSDTRIDLNETELMCKFGDINLYVGQRLNPDDKCIDCVCNQPPVVECVRRKIC